VSRAQTQCKEDFKVKQGLLSLAALALAVAAAAPATAQIAGGSIPTFDQGTFNLAEAYPCTPLPYDPALNLGELRLQTGICPPQAAAPGAAPGTLCLQRRGNFLDVNCFAVIPADQTGPCIVQSYRLVKEVPGSFKCPDVYGLPRFDADGKLTPYRYFQFGTGVRTWWSLNFTQPGTRFVLEVVSACRTAAPAPQIGDVRIHRDRWTWRVVADANTLLYVIELMHGGAISTLEVPCIIGEDMYDALKSAQSRLAGAIAGGNATNIGNAIFDMEALIVANCLFVDVLNPLVLFRGPDQTGGTPSFTVPGIRFPGNIAETLTLAPGITAVAGIIDTIEHPCCCKLLVDLEWISIRQGLIGQTPTLPTF
jgi:hypothetical protein